MPSVTRVTHPPAKPLLIYDGDCGFCGVWVRRWQHATGESVDYRPFQDAALAELFPEVSRTQFQTAVHLIEPNGAVFSGAEAVFRALSQNAATRWPVEWYEHAPGFAAASEWFYRLVARNRSVFSWLTRVGWGSEAEPSSYEIARFLFLRSLGLVYLVAFVSLWVQIMGLVGSNGILPASTSMEVMNGHAAAQHIGIDRYHLVPTLCWFNQSDAFLKMQCAAGTTLAIILVIGIAPVPCLFLLWLLYLSLATICNEFLGFQWDNLLLEMGFLGIFLAPLAWRFGFRHSPPPARLVLWLCRWLLFRLMFQSGCVKLLSGDVSWRHLTALNVHYETQPLPTWLAWYAHQMPVAIQKLSTILMFAIELAVPFLIFGPKRWRHFACLAFVLLQVTILLTGNYCFFNGLTVLLCLTLIEDAFWLKRMPRQWAAMIGGHFAFAVRSIRWPIQVTFPLFCIIMGVSLLQLGSMFMGKVAWPRPMTALYRWIAPFRTVNGYGLFAVMTKSRPEIIFQGSNDGLRWVDYEFKYKPGDLKRRPGFVEPHQPRLDWQMWFAALGNYHQNPWLMNFSVRLLQGSPAVLRLLKTNPFPAAPPRYVRALVYEYHFTDFATRRRTGAWWRRERRRIYLPPISLSQNQSK